MRLRRRRAVTLLVHIGAGKSGSTAIQQFLAVNRSRLADHGILVPGSDLSPDGDKPELHLGYFAWQSQEEMRANLAERLTTLVEVAQERRHSMIVLSAENLINPQGFAEMFQAATTGQHVRVLAFVRRQDDYLASAWQEWHHKTYGSLEEFLEHYTGAIDWHLLLSPWREAFDADNMDVRRYMSGEDVIDDLCQAIDVDVDQFVRPPRSNISHDERFVEVGHRHRDQLFEGPLDYRFFKYVEDELGEGVLKDYRGSTLLTLDQRHRIMADHYAANERLRSMHLGYLPADTPVFSEPGDADVHVLDPAVFSDEFAERLVTGFLRSQR